MGRFLPPLREPNYQSHQGVESEYPAGLHGISIFEQHFRGHGLPLILTDSLHHHLGSRKRVLVASFRLNYCNNLYLQKDRTINIPNIALIQLSVYWQKGSRKSLVMCNVVTQFVGTTVRYVPLLHIIINDIQLKRKFLVKDSVQLKSRKRGEGGCNI